MLNICFYGRRNFKGCHISVKVNLFNTVFIKFYVPLVVVLSRCFARSRDNFRKFWELCDCSFDRLSFSGDSLRVCLSDVYFMVCWFDVTIKLMVDMGNLTTLIYCFDLVIRSEVGCWWLRILVSCFNVRCSSSYSESEASTIYFSRTSPVPLVCFFEINIGLW